MKKSEGNMSNGKLEGPWTFWNSDGSKYQKGNYVNGKKKGFRLIGLGIIASKRNLKLPLSTGKKLVAKNGIKTAMK